MRAVSFPPLQKTSHSRATSAGLLRGSIPRAAIGSLALGTMLLVGCQSLEMTPENVAHVRVIAASPDSPAMDFYAGASALAYGVEFGSATSYVPLTPGAKVRLSATTASSAQTLVKGKAAFSANRQYTAVVANVAANLQETVYLDQTQPAATGQADVRILDAATRAGLLDVYLVPAERSLTTTLPARVGVALGASTGYIEQPAGIYSVVVVPAGTVPVASTQPLLTGAQLNYPSGSVRTIVLVDKRDEMEQKGISEIVAEDYTPG